MAEDLTHDRTPPSPGALQRLSPGVRRLVAPNPSPFTFTGTCTYVVGEGDVAVIDPGPESEPHLAALLAGLAGERVAHILVTHTHRDHSPGARALQAATGAPIHGCTAHVEIEGHASGRLDASHDLAYAPDVEMADGDTLRGAGYALTALHTPGHASNHLCFAFAQERALFSGDHVMAWSTSIVAPPDGRMSDYMASLDRLAGRDETVYWPGHGAPVTNPQRYVRGLASHRRMREASILERLAAGDAEIPAIVDRLYAGLDARLKPAAGLSVLAHLQDLVERGLVRSDMGAARLEARYAPA
ncbi:MAG TPA: MBL fold metallo-hydrolase [Beijerinckiaceae bacterium]|jgi:glyoxylase-like metal-dependent hydrolase (beta-lactamase superfamily II)